MTDEELKTYLQNASDEELLALADEVGVPKYKLPEQKRELIEAFTREDCDECPSADAQGNKKE